MGIAMTTVAGIALAVKGLGTGTILAMPAYQSLVPDMVPRSQLPDAAALNSISINLARAIGPAIAGLLIAQIGVAAVFALNTAALLCYAIVVACHPRLGGTPQSPERFLPCRWQQSCVLCEGGSHACSHCV